MRTVIATPLHSHPKRQYTKSLFGLTYHTARASDAELLYDNPAGSIIPQNREALVAAAKGVSADNILFIDGDQSFPETTLLRLAAHGLDVVGCNIILRGGGQMPSAWKDGKPVQTTPEKAATGGVEQVEVMGLGVCLINMSVFDRLKPPYFRYALMDRGNGPEVVGEDYGFFNALIGAGVPAYVDHALSREVRHVDEVELGF